MRIKSYFSGTVEAAMDLARRELGEDAVILNSRPAPAEARHLGAYEVVFGVEDQPQVQSSTSISTAAGSLTAVPVTGGLAAGQMGDAAERPDRGPAAGHRFELLESEIIAMRHELRKMSRGILAPESHWRRGGTEVAATAEVRRQDAEFTSFLVGRELPPGPAAELVRRARERIRRSGTRTSPSADGPARATVPGKAKPSAGLFGSAGGVFSGQPGLLAGMFGDESKLAAAVLEELAVVLRADARLGRPPVAAPPGASGMPGGDRNQVVALVGGPGVGKTTTLVKLAAHYGLRGRRPAHIISTDNLRVGASEQLRSYAAILGLGFDLAETTVALGQLLNEHAGKQLILIDTPGLSPGQMEDGAALARFLSTDPRVDCHVVVPAYQKGPDVVRLLDRFHPYGPAKVILTRLDETEAIGSLLLALDESEAPVSFLSMGQTIPEDLEPATVARLLDLFVGDPPMGAFFSASDGAHRREMAARQTNGVGERVLTAGSRL